MKGNVYIIKSKQTDKVYVGSTFYTLNQRFSSHKSHKDCTSKEILKYSDAEIILIECYECENKEQLRRREGEYIKQYDCVNEKIAGRTKKEYRKEYYEENKEENKEYREKNKEAIAQYQKEYREKNKEAIAEKSNEKFTCPCGGKYTYGHKSHHFKTKNHFNYFGK